MPIAPGMQINPSIAALDGIGVPGEGLRNRSPRVNPMRTSLAAALVALPALAAPAAAQSIMSLNHVVTNSMPHAECMDRANRTLSAAGLRYHDTTSEAQWGLSQDGQYMVSIYCLKTRDIAVFAATGAQGAVTGSLITRMINAWQGLDAGRGQGQGDAPPQPTPGK